VVVKVLVDLTEQWLSSNISPQSYLSSFIPKPLHLDHGQRDI